MPQIQIAASNLNIEPMQTLRYTADDYVNFLTAGGFDEAAGYEWNALRLPAARKAGRVLAERGYVVSLHESWNEDTVVSSLTSGLSSFKIAIGFPLLDKCYEQLSDVQTASQQQLPIVIHPSGQHLAERVPRRPRQTVPAGMFSGIWYQPTAEWASSLGIPIDSADTAAVAEQIITRQADVGLDKMAIDLHHIQATRNGLAFRNPAELAVALALSDSFGELQVSMRPDFGGKQKDLMAATDGRLAATKTGEILTAIAEALPAERSLRIVSEVAADEIQKSGFDDLAAAHQIINNSIRHIFGQHFSQQYYAAASKPSQLPAFGLQPLPNC